MYVRMMHEEESGLEEQPNFESSKLGIEGL